MWDRRAMLGAGASLAMPGLAVAKDRRTTLNAMLPSDLPHLCYPLLNNRQMQEICGNINESLLLFDWQFKPHPNLARAFEVSPDGLTYTFDIQPGVRWHDGTPFTARDVVFSCDVMLRELNPRSRAALSRCETITAKDAMTVVFKLREPFNAFLLSLMASTAPMMPAHIYEGTDFRTNPFNLKPIGTGPFKFQRWSRGQFVHLVRNQDYWRGAPQLTDLYFRLCPTPEQRMVALETGAVDIGFADDIDAVVTARLLANPRLAASTKAYDGTGEITVMEMNQRRWPFSDVRFRRAFMHAVDREFLVKAINFGQGKVAHSPIPSTAPYHDDRAVTKYEYNPARARALLDEIGLKPKRGGVRFSFRMMKVPDGGGTWSRCCQYVRQAMAEVGLDMQLESVDWATFGRRSGNWEFDMDCNAYGEYGDPAIGTSRFFLSSNIRKGVPQSNIQGYVNPEVDALFAKASAAIQPEEAQRHYSDIQRILTRDVAMMWMFERRPNLFYNRRLRDVVNGPNGPCDGLGRVTLA